MSITPPTGLTQQHQGISQEKTQNGVVTSIVFYGTEANCNAAKEAAVINSTVSGLGRLESVTVAQGEAGIYTATYKYTTAGYGGSSISTVTPPSTVIGEKSRTLDCTMLSSPIEQHPSYLKKWNYGLARKYTVAAADALTAYPTPPSWYDSATATSLIPIADEKSYRWFQSPSELPLEDGYKWVPIAQPVKPGVTNYDEASYTLTVLVRNRNWSVAEIDAANKANKIYTNANVGSGFTNGNWKCDRATVNWDGEYWITMLTFTYSIRGWDRTLYPQDGGNI